MDENLIAYPNSPIQMFSLPIYFQSLKRIPLAYYLIMERILLAKYLNLIEKKEWMGLIIYSSGSFTPRKEFSLL